MNIFRKKNMFTFVSALLLVMSGAVCASCGDDDEAASTSFDASAFAGFWTIPVSTSASGTTDLHLLMYPDGHLVYYTTAINLKRSGTWSYNASQNVLATSISLGGSTLQWEIESTGSGWWSGVEMGSDGYLANTARKGNAEDFARLILNDLTWDNTDKSSTVYSFRVQWSDTYSKLVASSLVYYHFNKKANGETVEDFDDAIWIEYTKDGIGELDYTFTTSVSDDYQTLLLMSSKAKITITNPLSYNVSAMKMAIEFDEFLLKYEVLEGGMLGSIGEVFIPTIDKFKGDFTVSK
ncbi:MAG: hypothetical protein J1E57_07280 [Prevotella sp.]|nr:hypothetical protein [Prevotella sp.]